MTIAKFRTSRKFLTGEQTESLIALLTQGCRRDLKQTIKEIISNTFYSLEDKTYWNDFKVSGNCIILNISDTVARKEFLKQVRDDIIRQRT
jgi:hypothetical protein